MRMPMGVGIAGLVMAAACAQDVPLAEADGETSVPQMQYTGTIERRVAQPWKGAVLFTEPFDDADVGARGWYDMDAFRTTAAVHAPGSAGAFECRFAPGASECAGGVPGRRLFDGVEELYISYWVRYSDDWVGSGRPYHPHEIHVMTNLDDRWAGPSWTHLTLYIEQLDLAGQVAIQDGRNVDGRCILRNDDVPVGCNGGPFASFAFGEDRSVAACNGLVGPVQLRDCYSLGGGSWYSARAWRAAVPTLGAASGTGGWHFVETYVRLNRVEAGTGIADGAIHYAVDGVPLLELEGVLLRTGRHADMRFNQLLIAPYMGDGSPVAQTMWLDELTVAHGRRP